MLVIGLTGGIGTGKPQQQNIWYEEDSPGLMLMKSAESLRQTESRCLRYWTMFSGLKGDGHRSNNSQT